MSDDQIAGLYSVRGQYRARVRVWGPFDPENCGGVEPCYSVTFTKDDGTVKWHHWLHLTEDSVEARGWELIRAGQPGPRR